MARWILRLGCITAAVCVLLQLAECQTRQASIFLIPDKYVGWVSVSYGVAEAPPLPTEHGDYLVTIPASGQLRTSTRLEAGIANDKFYYTTGSNRSALIDSGPRDSWMIWNDHAEFSTNAPQLMSKGQIPHQVTTTTRLFFVGFKLQFEKFDDFGRVGPIRVDRQLTGREMRYQNLRYRHMGRVNLEGADLTQVNAENSDFRKANLEWATLHGANLESSDLREARLQNADLLHATLRNANLHGADLRNAQLDAANLLGADLTRTDLSSAKYNSQTKWPEGFDPRQHGAILVPSQP